MIPRIDSKRDDTELQGLNFVDLDKKNHYNTTYLWFMVIDRFFLFFSFLLLACHPSAFSDNFCVDDIASQGVPQTGSSVIYHNQFRSSFDLMARGEKEEFLILFPDFLEERSDSASLPIRTQLDIQRCRFSGKESDKNSILHLETQLTMEKDKVEQALFEKFKGALFNVSWSSDSFIESVSISFDHFMKVNSRDLSELPSQYIHITVCDDKQLRQLLQSPNIKSSPYIRIQFVTKQRNNNNNKLTEMLEILTAEENFDHVKNITGLDLSYEVIAEAEVSHLEKLKNLTFLSLSAADITDVEVSHLEKLKNLTFLSLSSTGITDTGVSHLAKLKNLRSLRLSATNITDAGLSHLTGLTNLTLLSLNFNRCITDAGLSHLEKLKNLSSLSLNSTGASANGISLFIEKNPHVSINTF